MTTPSNPSGIPSLPVVGLLAVILFLGLALAPRAFEFRAWPEPPRQYATEEVVDRPAQDATPIEVAGVQRSRPAPDSSAAKAERPGRKRSRAEDRSARRSSRGSGSARRRGGRAPDPVVPDVVIESPTPAPPIPAPAAPEEPAQLAEVPPTEQVLRPGAPEVAPETPAVPEFEVVDLDARDELDERDRRHESGHRGRGHRGHGEGQRSGRGHRSGH